LRRKKEMPIDRSKLLPLSSKGPFSTTSEEHYGERYFLSGEISGYGGYNSQAFPMDRDAAIYKKQHKLVEMDKDENGNWIPGTGTPVLDVGSATGILVHAFRKIGVDAWGVDISQWAIDHPDHPDVAPFNRVGDVRALPFPDNSFDLILCLQTIEHIPEQEVIHSIPKRVFEEKYPFCDWKNNLPYQMILLSRE